MDKVVILLMPMGHWSAAGSLCSFSESKKAAKRENFSIATVNRNINPSQSKVIKKVIKNQWKKKKRKARNMWLFVIPRDENVVTYVPKKMEAS